MNPPAAIGISRSTTDGIPWIENDIDVHDRSDSHPGNSPSRAITSHPRRNTSLVLRRIFRRRVEPDVQIEKGLEKTRKGVFGEITKLFDRTD
ncbi:MAG TPA: hypothetical protein VFQ54_02255, partial [Thermomicrobiales bacterium]|nr:hypothetical protein [Thermomicrobiales bacterium]